MTPIERLQLDYYYAARDLALAEADNFAYSKGHGDWIREQREKVYALRREIEMRGAEPINIYNTAEIQRLMDLEPTVNDISASRPINRDFRA